MPAAYQPLLIEQNGDFIFTLTFWQDKAKTEMLDISAFTGAILAVAAKRVNNPTLLLSMSGNQFTFGTGTNGLQKNQVKGVLPASATKLITWEEAEYDFTMKDANGGVLRYMQGPINVSFGLALFT